MILNLKKYEQSNRKQKKSRDSKKNASAVEIAGFLPAILKQLQNGA